MYPGDVWLVDIPHLGTHEQSGKRPAIIIARVSKTIATIIPCTTNKFALRFPFSYEIEPNKINGLDESTIALVFHLRAIDVSLLKKKIGRLNKTSLLEIKELAKKLIG